MQRLALKQFCLMVVLQSIPTASVPFYIFTCVVLWSRFYCHFADFLPVIHKYHIYACKELWLHFCHHPHTSSLCCTLIDSSLGLQVSASGFMSASNCRSERSRRHKSCIFAGRLIQCEARHSTESIDTQREVGICFINHNAGSSVLHNTDTCFNLISRTAYCLQCH